VEDREAAPRLAALYRTGDGGRDWTPVASTGAAIPADGTRTSLWFRNRLDGSVGILLRDGSVEVAVTHDGGGSWRRQPLPEPVGGWNVGHSVLVGAPSVAPDGRGTLVVADTNRLNAVLGEGPGGPFPPAVAVYESADGGDTWLDPRPAPEGADPRLSARPFVGGRSGWLAGAGAVWTSADGGRTWRRRSGLPMGWTFATVAPVNGTVALAQGVIGSPAVASDGSWRLLLTDDGAGTWRDVPVPHL
jgi:photosystem II stability/assembly factor-like uncharacterized protein